MQFENETNGPGIAVNLRKEYPGCGRVCPPRYLWSPCDPATAMGWAEHEETNVPGQAEAVPMEDFAFSTPAATYVMPPTAHTGHDTPEPEKLAWSSRISIQAFVQRLSLMADLELPCTICLGLAEQNHCCRGVIRECSWQDGQLRLRGDDFSLNLPEDHIDSLHLVNRRRSKESETAVEILGTGGALLARIRSTADRERAAIWQDIMDSFAIATA